MKSGKVNVCDEINVHSQVLRVLYEFSLSLFLGSEREMLALKNHRKLKIRKSINSSD